MGRSHRRARAETSRAGIAVPGYHAVVFRSTRGSAAFLLLTAVLVVAACGSEPPATPGASNASPGASASGPVASASRVPGASASADPSVPTVSGFWTLAARALSKSGRMRLIMSDGGTHELRFEPKASAVMADNALASVCLTGAAYTVQGMRSVVVPGKWACGASALVSAFRKSGQPVYAWNTRLPVDTKIRERVAVASKGRWQWDYAATSRILRGTVKTTLLLDATTGRLISGSRTDPTGTTRFTFSYTSIFAPIALP